MYITSLLLLFLILLLLLLIVAILCYSYVSYYYYFIYIYVYRKYKQVYMYLTISYYLLLLIIEIIYIYICLPQKHLGSVLFSSDSSCKTCHGASEKGRLAVQHAASDSRVKQCNRHCPMVNAVAAASLQVSVQA